MGKIRCGVESRSKLGKIFQVTPASEASNYSNERLKPSVVMPMRPPCRMGVNGCLILKLAGQDA